MKGKILILSTLLSILTVSSFTIAGELSLQPSNGEYSPGCMIGIDIVMDPEGKEISATDIMIESSMKFIKFEAAKLFPYFFPPITTTKNMVHIVGFTSGPDQRVKEKGIVGRIYFKPEKSEIDGAIKFYIKKAGDTTDTNLSIGGGVDVLEDVWNGFYSFDGTSCEYPEEEIQEDINIEKQLDQTMKKVEKDHRSDTLQQSREDNKSYIISLFIIVIILVIYFKFFRGKYKKQ